MNLTTSMIYYAFYLTLNWVLILSLWFNVIIMWVSSSHMMYCDLNGTWGETGQIYDLLWLWGQF